MGMLTQNSRRESPDAPAARTGSLEVARALLGAKDEQLVRVVAFVDGLGIERGTADRLLESVRPRLAVLGLPRPLSFTRLLFMPLDPVIVPSAMWRPGGSHFPRGAIMPLATALHGALGDTAAAVDAACAGRATDDSDTIHASGAVLWPAAAAAIALFAGPPEGWEASGHGPDTFPALAALCAAAWRRSGRGDASTG